MEKIKYGWLQPANVAQVAKSLLKMDKADFQMRYQQEAFKGIRALEEMLCWYLLPTNNERSYSKYSMVEEAEQHLQNLLGQVQYLLTLLVPEKRVRLALESTSLKKEVGEIIE